LFYKLVNINDILNILEGKITLLD